MNITIFGASRGVGRAAVAIAASHGHTVTAVARTAAALAGQPATALAGNVLDAGFVARSLAGAEAVIVALGTDPSARGDEQQTHVCSRGTRVILDAMRAPLVRIVVVSSYGIGPTRANRPFPFNVIAATLLKEVMADKEIQEQIVRESEKEWTIAQPLGLTDAPATGRPLVTTNGRRGGTRVSRADVATVCVDALDQGRYLRETIAISASS
jgi:putative NADH-flavin reductase